MVAGPLVFEISRLLGGPLIKVYTWVPTGIISEVGNILEGAKFEIDGTGTNKGAENKNKSANSVNILICFKVILIVSWPIIVKN